MRWVGWSRKTNCWSRTLREFKLDKKACLEEMLQTWIKMLSVFNKLWICLKLKYCIVFPQIVNLVDTWKSPTGSLLMLISPNCITWKIATLILFIFIICRGQGGLNLVLPTTSIILLWWLTWHSTILVFVSFLTILYCSSKVSFSMFSLSLSSNHCADDNDQYPVLMW